MENKYIVWFILLTISITFMVSALFRKDKLSEKHDITIATIYNAASFLALLF